MAQAVECVICLESDGAGLAAGRLVPVTAAEEAALHAGGKEQTAASAVAAAAGGGDDGGDVDVDGDDGKKAGCEHAYCTPCLRQLLKTDFLEKGKSFLDLCCQVPRCGTRVSDALFRELCSGDGAEEMAEVLDEYEAWLESIPADPKAPTLSLPGDFSMDYNEKGELRHTRTGRKFHWVNQPHYDLLGDQVAPHIQQQLMMKQEGLQEIIMPSPEWLADPAHAAKVKGAPDHARNNVFMTPDALTNPNRLMLLIQGSGAVRAGQWARALCINDTLETGAILGYLQRARETGMGVIVFNPNLNVVDVDPVAGRPTPEELRLPGKPRRGSPPPTARIPGHEDPVTHTVHVWDHLAKQAVAKDIVIVAHSAGGWCTMGLLRARGEEEVMPRLRAIAFTDSVHSVLHNDPPVVRRAILNLAKNWVQSDEPLDTPVDFGSESSGCPCVSAGHPKHEHTSAAAITSVFSFLEERLQGAAGTAADAAAGAGAGDDA